MTTPIPVPPQFAPLLTTLVMLMVMAVGIALFVSPPFPLSWKRVRHFLYSCCLGPGVLNAIFMFYDASAWADGWVFLRSHSTHSITAGLVITLLFVAVIVGTGWAVYVIYRIPFNLIAGYREWQQWKAMGKQIRGGKE